MGGFFGWIWSMIQLVAIVALGYRLWCACDTLSDLRHTVETMGRDIKALRERQEEMRTAPGGMDRSEP